MLRATRCATETPETGPESRPQTRPQTSIDLRTIGKSDRTRLGGPALRTFTRIADDWHLAERDRLAVLGEPGRSTFHAWRSKAQAHTPVTLPLDTLLHPRAVQDVIQTTHLELTVRATGKIIVRAL